MNPHKTKAVVIGGLISGILSVIPGVQACNCCCCLWVILGGVIAAYVLAKADPSANSGDGAIVGAGAGLMAGLMAVVVVALQYLFVGTDQMIQNMKEAIEQMSSNPGMPPETRQAMEEVSRTMLEIVQNTGPLLPILGTLLMVPIYAGIGAIGGLIGMAIFNKPQNRGGYFPPPGPGYPPYGQQGYPPQYPSYPAPPGQSQFSQAGYPPGAYPPPPPPFPAPQPPQAGYAPAAPAEPPRNWGPPPVPPGSGTGSGSEGSGSGGGDPFAPPS